MGNPHKKYIKHLEKGGRVLRIDSLNKQYQILTVHDMDDIEMMGHNDLIILKDDKLSAVDMLELIFKQQRESVQLVLKDIITVINQKSEDDIRPMTATPEHSNSIINADGTAYDFKMIIIGFDEKEHIIDAQIFVDNESEIILNLYPQVRVIGPYKSDIIYDEIDKAATEEIGNHGLLCFVTEVQDVIDYVSNKD